MADLGLDHHGEKLEVSPETLLVCKGCSVSRCERSTFCCHEAETKQFCLCVSFWENCSASTVLVF